jgi:BirA family biotin operon repressor/biotin-[acetyl-CoA-carboxylase] ligase
VQTGGKGRQGRSWVSPPGNLYASTLVRLRPGDPQPVASLSLVAAVALHETAQAYAPEADLRIKWPNDLLAGGAKLAGILLERSDDAVIVGLGVNLAEFPDNVERPATSLLALAGIAPDPANFLTDLAQAFAAWLSRWRGEGLAIVRTAWLDRAHPLGTALTSVAADGSRIDGLFDGLDESGALRLRLPDGSCATVQAGDVFLI